MQDYADLLISHTFADKVFFCNSGTEAVETGLKIMRRYQQASGQPQRTRIITFNNSFHGRTLAASSAGGLAKCWDNLGPPIDIFDRALWNDIDSVKAAISEQTAGILLETIQGDGGIVLPADDFLIALRELTERHGLLLMLDEVQTGMGRTGRLFAHEHWGITPDIMSAAKGLGSGFPLGACLVTERVAGTITTGVHGSTYGGNPLAMAVGKAVLEYMSGWNFLDHVMEVSQQLINELMTLQKRYPKLILEVRGKGLLLGLKINADPRSFFNHLAAHGLLTAPAGNNVLRLLPPLIVEEMHIKEAIQILDKACANFKMVA